MLFFPSHAKYNIQKTKISTASSSPKHIIKNSVYVYFQDFIQSGNEFPGFMKNKTCCDFQTSASVWAEHVCCIALMTAPLRFISAPHKLAKLDEQLCQRIYTTILQQKKLGLMFTHYNIYRKYKKQMADPLYVCICYFMYVCVCIDIM